MQASITQRCCPATPARATPNHTQRLQLVQPRHISSSQAQHVSQDTVTTAAVPSKLQAVPASSVQDSHPEAYQQCVQELQGLGFDELDAEKFIQRAFGWGARARAYWRHEKKEQAPDAQQIQAVLAFLQSLGMDQLQVTKTVKAFPEVLGCAVDSQLQGNVAQLQKEWKLEGDVLRGAVLRNPSLLGYNVDCLGDCAGECNRCWVRF